MTNHAAFNAERWQRAPTASLPGAFIAYNDSLSRRERAVTFALPTPELQLLLERSREFQDLRYVIHLGLRDTELGGEIPDTPAFTPFVQPTDAETGNGYEGVRELTWAPDSRFSKIDPSDPDSGVNAIPSASAYNFVYAWLETPEADLGKLFMGVGNYEGRRVISYRFTHAESMSILQDIAQSLNGEHPGLAVHLGRGPATSVHPFAFRPVLEVSTCAGDGEQREAGRDVTGLINDCGDTFYDYSIPNPPG